MEEFKKAYGGGVQVRTPGQQKEANMIKGGRQSGAKWTVLPRPQAWFPPAAGSHVHSIHSTDVPCSCAVGKRRFKLESGCCLGHMRLSRFILDLAGRLCRYFSKLPGIGSSPWYGTCCPHVLSHPIPSLEGMHIGPSLPRSGSERLYWEESAAKIPRVYP